MDAHAGAQHDFTRDVRRLGHLHHLAKHQLFDKLRIDTAARQQLAHRRFP